MHCHRLYQAEPQSAGHFVGWKAQHAAGKHNAGRAGAIWTTSLAMIQYIAENYPVDSISVNEMFYHADGYGPDDKTAFTAYSGLPDWPRTSTV